MRTWLIRAVLVFSSIMIALLAVELVLRATGKFKPPAMVPREDMYVPDPDVGYRLAGSLDTTYRYPRNRPDLVPVVSNSDGFRMGREFDEPDSRSRILVIGDSFVFGDGVRAEERLTEQLEAIEPGWRVDNLGMTGWGVDLMIRGLEHIGPRARPDVVVLCVYTDDFRRLHPYYLGRGNPIPKFELRDGELVSVPYPAPGGLTATRIYQAVYQTYWRNQQNRWDLHEALLNRFLEDAERLGFSPVLAFLPGKLDTPKDRARRTWLGDWASTRGIPYLDLTEAIHGAGVAEVYLTDNWHWNAAGHRIAAEELHALISNGILQPAGVEAGANQGSLKRAVRR